MKITICPKSIPSNLNRESDTIYIDVKILHDMFYGEEYSNGLSFVWRSVEHLLDMVLQDNYSVAISSGNLPDVANRIKRFAQFYKADLIQENEWY